MRDSPFPEDGKALCYSFSTHTKKSVSVPHTVLFKIGVFYYPFRSTFQLYIHCAFTGLVWEINWPHWIFVFSFLLCLANKEEKSQTKPTHFDGPLFSKGLIQIKLLILRWELIFTFGGFLMSCGASHRNVGKSPFSLDLLKAGDLSEG